MPIFAALIPAAIGGVSSIVGGLIGKKGADKQAATQAATNAKIDEYGRPYREAGTNYLSTLETNYGGGDPATLAARRAEFEANFKNSPLYRMTYEPAYAEAEKAVTRYGSAGGSLNSGRTLMALQDRAARIGGQTFGNYLSGITHGADQGQAAAFGSAGQLQTGTNALNSAYGASGDALAAGALGLGKAGTSAFDSYNYNNALAKYGPATGAFPRSSYGG